MTAWLAGELAQGRVGLGPAAVREVRVDGAPDEPSLSVAEVDAAFGRIAAARGAGSKAAKLGELAALLARATAPEQEFLRRLVVGELRQGALEGILAEAVDAAAGVERALLRRAILLGGRLQDVASAALLDGEEALAAFRLELFRPLAPMLAGTASDPADALARLGPAAFQFKLDGARVQVHRAGDEVRVYTRRLHDVTAAVPEVVEAARALPVREVVLDGEVLAHGADGRPLPFQTTMRRFGRKLDVAALRAELPVRATFFDLLHLDGETWIDRGERERWAALRGVAPETARDPRGGFVMLGKTFKGMTDAVLAWQTAALLAREVRRVGHVVFVRPELVVEIAFDGVQASPQYPGGVALRFARLRRYRDDKTAAEADTVDAVRALAPAAG